MTLKTHRASRAFFVHFPRYNPLRHLVKPLKSRRDRNQQQLQGVTKRPQILTQTSPLLPVSKMLGFRGVATKAKDILSWVCDTPRLCLALRPKTHYTTRKMLGADIYLLASFLKYVDVVLL